MNQQDLTILYEDKEIIVCEKPPGVPSQSDKTGDYDMAGRIRNHLAGSAKGIPYVGIVHRLDRPVGGVMVYAKTKRAAAGLSAQVQAHEMKKRYFCIVTGLESGVFEVGASWRERTDFLLADKQGNLSRIVPPETAGAKKAILLWRLLESAGTEGERQDTMGLVEVELKTGRHHQIRVQMAGSFSGIWGDTKYHPAFIGKKGWYDLALFSHLLSFRHPATGEPMSFEAVPETELFRNFDYIRRLRLR